MRRAGILWRLGAARCAVGHLILVGQLVFVIGVAGARSALGMDYPPGDHQGGDLVLQDGDRIWGAHYNISRFEVPSTATVTVRPYEPSVPGTGSVDVRAERVSVLGVLDATGAGYTGGGGGVGGPGTGTPGKNLAGKPGTPGEGRYPGFTGPSIGDGPFGGKAGWPPRTEDGEDGGYQTAASNGDVTTDTSIHMGSGGQGGIGFPSADTYFGMPGGGGGGSGGGSVALWAVSRLEVHGRIATSGVAGQNGEKGKSGRYWEISPGEFLIVGGDGANGGSALPWQGGLGGQAGSDPNIHAGKGGAGAGGGILLVCTAPGGLALQGSLDARGGRDQMSNGGTVKIFYRGDTPATTTIQSPRIYLRDLDQQPLRLGPNELVFR